MATCSKKSKMKTAKDVVHRILWDNAIPKEYVTIGYLDRFMGTVEKPFEDFSWEPLDSIDNNTFGIPEHRIEYFKFKKVIVWDKKGRLDKFFGSSGTTKTIYDVMENYSDEENKIDNSQNNVEPSESESDESIPPIRDSVIYSPTQSSKSSKSTAKTRETPNYFICQRILGEDFVDKALNVQSYICKENPVFESLCYKPVLFHVTLCVLQLKDEAEEKRCIRALEEVKKALNSLRPKDPLKMKGVNHFDSRVLYVGVELTKQLQDFVAYLISHLTAHNFKLFDTDRYVPHITLLKLNRKAKSQLGVRKVNTSVCKQFEDLDFGTQILDTIHVCAMSKPKDPSSGFYYSPGHLNLHDSTG